MIIAKQTPTELRISLDSKTWLLAFGVIILVVGLLTIFFVKTQPLMYSPEALSLLEQLQADPPGTEPDFLVPSIGNMAFDLARYANRQLLVGEHLLFLGGVFGIVVGIIILIGTNRSRTVTFDSSQQQVIIKQPSWLFGSKTETYPFQNIAEVRVTRDRETTGKTDYNYRVELVIGHSEGKPLSHDYVYYKTVFPLSKAYQYDYNSAQDMVDTINQFMSGKWK